VSIYLSGELSGLNKKIVAITLLVFMSLAVALTPFLNVHGQNSLGVEIIRVTPASEANAVTSVPSVDNGTAGELYNVQGTIYTGYGTYNIIMGNTIVASGTANDYYVNVNFTVPQLPGGDYAFVIEDIKQQNLNSTGNTPVEFLILPNYIISSVNSYNQEGSTVALNAEITGGSAKVTYAANITVVLPSPLNGNYSDVVTMTANSLGTASAQLDFPSSSFQAGDSLQLGGLSPTDFAGNYTLYFNMSQGLSTNQFIVGFLDAASYHRGQTATVAAPGYAAGQTATLSVTSVVTGTSLVSQSMTANSNGVMTASFAIPSNTAVGNCKATITTTSGSAKLMQDVQIFLVPGYSVTITTLNLDGQAVSKILVKVQDQNANTFSNATSNSNGHANFMLEVGPCLLTAYYEGVTVGNTNITVTGAGSFNFECQLTNLQILVQNENGTAMSFVTLSISYNYGSKTASVTAETGSGGTYALNSTLSGVSYVINASMYGRVFNVGNNTITSLPAQATYRFTIICPTEQATFNVVGYNDDPISGADLRLVELTNGLFYTATTDSSGSASAPLTFGEYKLQIYQNGILINETTIKAFAAETYPIRCTLYGIEVSVSVVDYFGQPISDANVTVNGPSQERYSATTQSDGKTTFSDIVGGNLQIVAFAKGAEDSYQAVSMNVNQPTSVQIQMSNYVAFGSLLIPTTALFTLIAVIVAVVLLVVVELFLMRRRRHTTES
jgi:hypothetical protein